MKITFTTPLLLIAVVAALAAGCPAADGDTPDGGTEPDVNLPSDADMQAVVDTYADVVLATYTDAHAEALDMQTAIEAFIADPTEGNLSAAKTAWLNARNPYGETEVFRFYEGPIDFETDDASGPEGQLNAWPMDELHVDYVEGNATAGIINNVADYPNITLAVILGANGEGGEENVSTGYHAIEFLLWGQDLAADGPGARPATDYDTADNADRRGEYLSIITQLLVDDLAGLITEWEDGQDNYRKTFVELDPKDGITHMLTGMGALSGFELAGERIFVAYDSKLQEDEHSCFSDNTHNDVIRNAMGIRNVFMGSYGNTSGDSLYDLVGQVDSDLADDLKDALDASVDAAEAIPVPFDQAILGEDSDAGRTAVLATVEALEAQEAFIVDVASLFDITLNLPEE